MRFVGDITIGQRFSRWTVLERAGYKNNNRKWLCKCECGGQSLVSASNLKSGGSKSCGCLKRESTVKRNYKHGQSVRKKVSSEYYSWTAMIARCTRPKNQKFKDYGGRGITVCERWINSFEAFIEDMGNKPTPKHTIDRKNNNGNYDPENCRWATAEQQSSNKRVQRNNKSGVSGVFLDKNSGKWVATINLNKKQVYLGSFKEVDEAIKTRKKEEELKRG